MLSSELAEVVRLAAEKPAEAAAKLRNVAAKLIQAAEMLEKPELPLPILDRVIARVIGPDGQVKQEIDTGAHP